MALHYPALANIVGYGLAVIDMLSARRFIRFCLHCSVGLLAIVYQIPAAAMQKEIHVVGDRSFNPYEFCTFFSNKAQGILVDQWRLMAKRNSIHITYTCDDWEAAQDSVATGRADAIGGMIRSDEREKRFSFVKRIVMNPPEYYYYSPTAFKEEPTLDSLVQSHAFVGVTRGDYAQEWFSRNRPDVQVKLYDTYLNVVKAAYSGELHVFAMEESIASHHLNDLGITHLFTRSSKHLFREWLWTAVRKDNIALASQLQQAFANVSDDELARIEIKWANPRGFWRQVWDWMESYVEDSPLWFLVGTLTAVYISAILIIFAAAPYWIYKLSSLARRLDIEFEAGPVKKIPTRWIFLVTLLEGRSRVLDALLRRRREVIIRNFAHRKTVSDRQTHYFTPYIIDGERIDVSGAQERKRQLASRFRLIFRRRAPCILITGDGGTGKTSLAVWIARNALLLMDDPQKEEEHIFERLTLPIILETDADQDLLSSIHGQCNALMEDDVPRSVLISLLSSGRILVIIDGFSEKSQVFRSRLAAIDPSIPRFSAIVTSRREEELLGGLPVTRVQPCKLSKTALAAFLEFILRHLGIWNEVGDEKFFASCQTLSKIVGHADVSPVFVVLYARLFVATSLKMEVATQIRNVPDLFWEYANSLNRSMSPDRISDREVHRALRVTAWCCISATYQPVSASLLEVQSAIDENRLADAAITYLHKTLGLLEVIQPAQTHLRFVLDPVAEYFAASYLFEEGLRRWDESGRDEWERIVRTVTSDPLAPERGAGFYQALVDVYASIMPAPHVPQAVRECIAVMSAQRATLQPA